MSWQPELGDLFEEALKTDDANPKPLAALITNELVARVGDGELSDTQATPAALAQLVALTAGGKVSVTGARTVLDKLHAEGGDASQLTPGLPSAEDPSLIPEMTSDSEIQLEKVVPPQQAPQ